MSADICQMKIHVLFGSKRLREGWRQWLFAKSDLYQTGIDQNGARCKEMFFFRST